ncbi:MAG: transposase [Planctomycetota bacterium]|nr:transposase [Planctomycetota bacterium]
MSALRPILRKPAFVRFRNLHKILDAINYIVGLAKNEVLKRLTEPHLQRAKEQFELTGQKQRIFAEVEYCAATWDRRRRVVIKAEHGSGGANQRFVVSNPPSDPQLLYDQVYCQRGDMENRIKEQQLDLFADRTSCHGFVANQFRLLLSSAAYVLLESLRRLGLEGTELSRSQSGAIRLILLKIGARITCSFRRVVLHLAVGYPFKELFARVLSRLRNPVLAPT